MVAAAGLAGQPGSGYLGPSLDASDQNAFDAATL